MSAELEARVADLEVLLEAAKREHQTVLQCTEYALQALRGGQ